MSTITKAEQALKAKVALDLIGYMSAHKAKTLLLRQAQQHIKALRNRLYRERLARAVNSFPTSIRLGGFY